MARTYRARLPLLFGVGLLIFAPLGLLELLDETLQEPLADADADPDAARIAVAAAAAVGHVALALVGEVFYAGVVAAAVTATREGRDHSLLHVARTLPYGRLVAVDVLLALVLVLGLVLLVLPGLVFLAWFALVAPAVKIDDRRVIDAFRRSRALVTGNTGRVLVLILSTLLLEVGLASGLQSLAIGDGFLSDWLVSVGANLLAAPIYAVAVVVVFFELRQPPGLARPRP